jgi:hypothetical protein
MKTLLVIVLLFAAHFSFAKIWIVDSNAGSTAKDFTDLQAAHDGATAGDTLYLIGSPVNYIGSELLVTKRLVIIGPGYFLNQNANLQANLNSALINNTGANAVTFDEGSEGSVLMGITLNGTLTINANNILVKRNYISQGGNADNVSINASNIIMSQNYFYSYIGTNSTVISISPGLSGIIINNNYIHHFCANGCGGGTRFALLAASTASIELSNNIFFGNVTVANSLVQNNISLFTSFTSTASLVRNNSGDAGNYYPSGNDNNSNASDFTNAFVPTGTSDGKWQLGASSLFIGTGYNGTDRGIFGGPEPYVLSGIPPIPTIYFLTAPTIGEKNTGLPVQIKVKSNN